ncbi:MAG: hypothetical protein ACQCXQ_09125 [Verrucomicrobiales bacterium]|nr:hypothetical protein [Verrucomicrobiota bacterium JB025]
MKSSHPPITCLTAAACLALASSATHAAVIFQASATNTTEIVNTSNDLDALTITGDTDGGTLVIDNQNGSFNNGGFASSQTVGSLNSGSLTSMDALTMTLTVDSITGPFRANGVTFGLTDDNSAFGLGAAGLGINVRANGSTTTLSAGFGTADSIDSWGATEASIMDGFTVTLTADVNGYRFSFTDLIAQGTNPIVDITGTFSGTEFVDNFSAGYFYETTQKFNTTDATITTISEASIDVIPEPSTTVVLGLFCGIGAFLRRRG